VTFLGAVLLLSLSAKATVNDPFDAYLTSVKKHELSSPVLAVAKRCGFSSTTEQPIYAVSVGGKWTRSHNLPKAVYDTESDFFSSAEVWRSHSKAKVIILWSLSLDVGSEVRTIACLDDHGSPTSLQVSNWSIDAESGKQEWLYQKVEKFDESGRVIAANGRFEDEFGNEIAKPKTTEDIEGSFDWAPDPTVFKQIQTELVGSRGSRP
jgi:hypothetical protein